MLGSVDVILIDHFYRSCPKKWPVNKITGHLLD